MGVSYIRRFTFDPGQDVLINIESVDILDLDPPAAIAGAGTGVVNIVGEFENGPFNASTQVAGGSDLARTFGSFGYTLGGVSGVYPCAVQRQADSAILPEFWNGNGMVHLNGKQFGSLLVTRVDTSVGSVQLTPNAYVTGAAAFRYALSPGQVLGLDLGAGPLTATFTATAGTVTSGSQTFNTGFTGGEQLVLGYDSKPNITVTFLSTDQTQAQVIARINTYAGFAFAASVSGTTMSLTGIGKGNQANVRVVSGTSSALTALGLSVAQTFGTGNVADIQAVTPQEIAAIVQAAVANSRVEQDQNGALRVSNTLGTASSFVYVTSATTASGLGFTAGQYGTNLGVAALFGSGGSFPTATAGTFTMSYDGGNPFTVTVTTTQAAAAVISAINAAAGATIAYADGAQIAILGKAPGGSVNVISASAPAVVTQLGLRFGNNAGTALPYGTIPAGTIVQNAGATTVLVTMQDVQFTAGGIVIGTTVQPTLLGPWTVKVRHAIDNGAGASANAGTLTSVPYPVQLMSVSATNPQATGAALSEAAIDAAYAAAIASTADINTVAKTTNIIYAARQSNTVRKQLRQNAITASANGVGRMAVIRPPMGTTKDVAKGQAEPGNQAYAHERVIYCYPAFSTYVPIIGRRGVSGGAGFTATGNVDAGADGWMASILSQLPPEEDPGQATAFTGGVVSLESSPNVQGFQMEDYIAFKAAGIAASRIDDGLAFFQSGCVNLNPTLFPQLVNISRRRMADYIQGTLAGRLVNFGKKLATEARRNAMMGEVRSWMDGLLSVGSPASQRIAGFALSKGNNTLPQLGAGLFRITLSVRTLNSLKAIVLETTVGEQVQVVEQIAA